MAVVVAVVVVLVVMVTMAVAVLVKVWVGVAVALARARTVGGNKGNSSNSDGGGPYNNQLKGPAEIKTVTAMAVGHQRHIKDSN